MIKIYLATKMTGKDKKEQVEHARYVGYNRPVGFFIVSNKIKKIAKKVKQNLVFSNAPGI